LVPSEALKTKQSKNTKSNKPRWFQVTFYPAFKEWIILMLFSPFQIIQENFQNCIYEAIIVSQMLKYLWVLVLMPVILATWEAEIRRIKV
jgi:hypothetical protein